MSLASPTALLWPTSRSAESRATLPGATSRGRRLPRGAAGSKSMAKSLALSLPPLLLGSRSRPRRRLLEEAGVELEVQISQVDEKSLGDRASGDAETLVRLLATAKADALLASLDDPSRRLLLTADQVVTYEGQIREKPESMQEARAFLASYALAPCRTVGALCLHDLSSRQRVVGVQVADIFFKPSIASEDVLTELESESALLDCAGALMVEHPLIECHVDRVEGGLDSVQGLSLPLLRDLWGQLQDGGGQVSMKSP
ncbi:unnamed protein product [Symbiodinium sp. CCMP2456]|nr:unnamed protein product [Symbiodinium sp. CCMP2456]